MNNVDTFVTENGTKYIFDGTTGFISPISDNLFNIVNNTDELDRDLIYDHADRQLKAAMNKWEFFKVPHDINMDISFIERNIQEYPYPQLILSVTEHCNLRCKYCIFSGKYIDMRTHRSKTMSLDTALESVDYYIALQGSFKKYAPEKESVISFYGGEPLINYSLIKSVVEHVKKHNFRTFFAITTNTMLFTAPIVEYLVTNNFLVSISLDGPEEEHDRNRVYSNGRGTHKAVMENIQMILDEIKNQGKSDSLPVMILTCYDEKTNMMKLNDFFKQHEVLQSLPGRASQVIHADMETPKNKTMPLLFNQYLCELKNGANSQKLYFGDRLFGTLFKMILGRNVMPYGSNYTQYLGSSCIPGGKIFVDTDGIFHTCEKINYNFPIGNSKCGLDYSKILNILQKWSVNIRENCVTCAYKLICGLCFANCTEGSSFEIDNFCRGERNKTLNSQLSYVHSLLEYDPEIMRNYVENRSIVNRKYLRLTQLMKTC